MKFSTKLIWYFPLYLNSGRTLPSSWCVTVGDQSFATAGPRLWNSLPADVRSASSLTIFRRKL